VPGLGEEANLDGPALEILLDRALDGVRGAQAPAMMAWQGEDGEALGDGTLQPQRRWIRHRDGTNRDSSMGPVSRTWRRQVMQQAAAIRGAS